MSVARLPFSLAGQLITAMLGGILIIGPAGCNGLQFSLNGGGTASLFGLLINTDATSDLLGALRLQDGNAVFVYGTHKPDGNVDDVQAAVLKNAAGEEASVNFDGGLLSKAKGFDGSTLTVTYDERTTLRLRGHVDIFLAGADPADQNQTLSFDIDLQQALADLAAQIQQLSGVSVSTAPPPTDPGSRVIVPDASAARGKGDNAQLVFLFVPFFAYAFSSAGYLMVQVVGQFMKAMVQTLVTVTQSVVVAACAPFILMGEILRGAGSQPVATTNIIVQLALAGVLVPKRPYL